MTYLITGVLGILAYIKKDSKIIMLMIFAFFCILFTFASKIPDLHNYQLEYINQFPDVTEPIYIFLRKLFSGAGLEYIHYRFFLSVLGFGLISAFILEYSPTPAAVLFLYFIYPLAIDAVQVRSFLATGFAVFSLRYIIKYHETHKNKYIIFFCITLLLGVGFHVSILLYVVLLGLIVNIDKNKLLLYVGVPVGIFCTAICISFFQPLIEQMVGAHKAENWASETRMITLPGIIRISFPKVYFVMLLVLFLYATRKKIGSIKLSNLRIQDHNLTFIDKDTDKILFLAALYGFSTVAFEVVVAGDYERMSRASLVWSSVLASRCIKKESQLWRMVMWTCWGTGYVLYFITVYILRPITHGFVNESFLDYVFKAFMENNTLIG